MVQAYILIQTEVGKARDVAAAIEKIPGVVRVERLIRHYAEGGIGETAVIVGSSGYLEVVANQASAAKILGVGVGAPVELSIY